MPWQDSGILRVRVLPEYREASAASIDSPGRARGPAGSAICEFGLALSKSLRSDGSAEAVNTAHEQIHITIQQPRAR